MAPVLALLSAVTLAQAPAWPREGAALSPPALPAPPARKVRVAIDAGHGAPGNHGAQSCRCEAEEDFTLREAGRLAEALEATGAFEVLRLRDGDGHPSYARRIRDAVAFGAQAVLSLHFDVRGEAVWWSPAPGLTCARSLGRETVLPPGVPPEAAHDSSGFAVLWSAQGEASLVARRAALGRALAVALADAGLEPYDGVDYPGLYRGDETPGGFVDAHPPRQRIWMLSRPELPVLILETHHALDVEERARWDEPATHRAVAAAVAAALLETLRAPAPATGARAGGT
ncbi:MAG: N-acetylmuramoyl-L-alanine amidase [Myxococcaceae bacterium]|nr:N-acetylmuramoyl-L-alanine amidase [Myxococcaceae bacterium]